MTECPFANATTETMNIMDRLRTETRPQHDAAENAGFGTRVMSGGLTLEHYVQHLRAWKGILSHLEDALRSSNDPIVQGVWNEGLEKTTLLTADLVAIGNEVPAMNAQTTASVEAFNVVVDRCAEDNPAALLGMLYVLEGSTHGATIMRPRIAEQLGLSDGLAYYGVYGNDVHAKWKVFRENMSNAVNGTGAEDAIVDAAKSTFDGVGAVLRAIIQD